MKKQKRCNWVFGYGSLVCPDSLSKTLERSTTPGFDVFPAVLKGFKRSWCVTSVSLGGRVYLGIEKSSESPVLGVLIRAYTANEDLRKLDAREGLYHRVELNQDDLAPFGRWILPRNARFLTYIPHFRIPVSPLRHHISQGYAAVVDRGARGWGEEFYAAFDVEPCALEVRRDSYGED